MDKMCAKREASKPIDRQITYFSIANTEKRKKNWGALWIMHVKFVNIYRIWLAYLFISRTSSKNHWNFFLSVSLSAQLTFWLSIWFNSTVAYGFFHLSIQSIESQSAIGQGAVAVTFAHEAPLREAFRRNISIENRNRWNDWVKEMPIYYCKSSEAYLGVSIRKCTLPRYVICAVFRSIAPHKKNCRGILSVFPTFLYWNVCAWRLNKLHVNVSME